MPVSAIRARSPSLARPSPQQRDGKGGTGAHPGAAGRPEGAAARDGRKGPLPDAHAARVRAADERGGGGASCRITRGPSHLCCEPGALRPTFSWIRVRYGPWPLSRSHRAASGRRLRHSRRAHRSAAAPLRRRRRGGGRRTLGGEGA